MARRNTVPSYRLHKQSGQAVVTLTDAAAGRRRDVLLGPYGTQSSRAEYARVIGEWELRGRALAAAAAAPADLTVSELILAFWRHAEAHYRHPDGTPTGELDNLRHALRPLRERYGQTAAASFGPLSLKALRQGMVDAGLCRTLVNQRVGAVRRVFKWAAGEELVPVAVFQALAALAGLQKGRTPAREREPVGAVADAHVNAVLPFLTRPVAAMVRLQRLTGCRPGEAAKLRADLIDRAADVWYYRPRLHKTAHKGRGRVIVLGPRAQQLLVPFLAQAGPNGYLFSPSRSMADFRARLQAARKSKARPPRSMPPKTSKRRMPGEYYTTRVYARAISRACIEAALADLAARRPDLLPPVRDAENRLVAARSVLARATTQERSAAMKVVAEAAGSLRRATAHAAQVGGSVAHWHPNQLRHTHGTETRRRYGLEGAQVALGHSKADVTQLYAERDLALAERIAREVG